MNTVTLEKEKTVLIQSDEVDTVVSENNSRITVTEVRSTTIAQEIIGNLVHQEEQKEHVVQGGLQGPPGIPGTSTQFEYVVAGQTVGGNRAVTTNNNGQLVYPDPSDIACRVYGITTQSAQQGELVTVQIAGTQTEPSWNWNLSLPIFLGINGTLTQTPPSVGQSIIVGYPNSPTKLFIDRQPPIYMG